MIPLEVKVKEKYLQIKWDDSSETTISLTNLRRFCPCAICTSQDESHHHDYIKVYSDEQITLKSINIVGNYAVGVRWADNHNTGIYDFNYLKKISDL
ncbi:MAG: DUF971 domain-containing protein [Ignavibacteriales bacterium]|nr:DUF971 domain-containing protein [Ignavibacteriales bacterium]